MLDNEYTQKAISQFIYYAKFINDMLPQISDSDYNRVRNFILNLTNTLFAESNERPKYEQVSNNIDETPIKQ